MGESVIVAAHGNSLRALVKYLDNVSDADIVELNIPTGQPLVYDLDENLNRIRSYYLGDDLLTLDDVSKWLKVKESWIFEQTRNRARVRSKHPFPFVKMAGLLRFSRMRIAEWLAENST